MNLETESVFCLRDLVWLDKTLKNKDMLTDEQKSVQMNYPVLSSLEIVKGNKVSDTVEEVDNDANAQKCDINVITGTEKSRLKISSPKIFTTKVFSGRTRSENLRTRSEKRKFSNNEIVSLVLMEKNEKEIKMQVPSTFK